MYSSQNQRVSIALNPDLIDWVDQIISDALKDGLKGEQNNLSPETIEQKRTEAIEAAIQLWCKQQTQQRLQRSADLHRQRHNNDETGWLV